VTPVSVSPVRRIRFSTWRTFDSICTSELEPMKMFCIGPVMRQSINIVAIIVPPVIVPLIVR